MNLAAQRLSRLQNHGSRTRGSSDAIGSTPVAFCAFNATRAVPTMLPCSAVSLSFMAIEQGVTQLGHSDPAVSHDAAEIWTTKHVLCCLLRLQGDPRAVGDWFCSQAASASRKHGPGSLLVSIISHRVYMHTCGASRMVCVMWQLV